MANHEFVGFITDAHHRLEDLTARNLWRDSAAWTRLHRFERLPAQPVCRREDDDPFYSFWSFLSPITVYRYDFK
jgi:hypothetical protein